MSNLVSPILALQQQRLLLQLEQQAEKEAFRKQSELTGVERMVRRGHAWWPVVARRSFYNSLNQYCVEVFRTSTNNADGDEADDETASDHSLEPGRPIVFFAQTATATHAAATHGAATRPAAKPSLSYFHFTATISYVDRDRMVVALPDESCAPTLQTSESLGLQLAFDETSYRAMLDALDRVISARSGRLAYLRNLFYSHQQPAVLSFAPLRFPYLNESQQLAVNRVLWAKDVAIVHGPPGTGKTTTLVEAIYETLRREPQVLVCAQSNMAVDWISEKLVDRGVHVLRIGNPTRVNDKMLSYTYERRFESHPDYELLWAIRKAMRQLRQQHRHGDEKYHQKMERLRERATELEVRINASLFGQAHVVATTLVGAAHRLLDGHRFGTLFIDEAAQALEAACWIPMRRCSRLILAGDHCQLPPTVKSVAALKAGLGTTLMERIAANLPQAVTMLTVQYRMNEDIMRFSSEWFYNGRMTAAPTVRGRSILDLDKPMEWITPPDAREAGSESRYNEQEALLTLATLQQYLDRIGLQRVHDERLDVGIISPYRAQVQLLRRLLKRSDFFRKIRKVITVNTVDGFQGQERDIIVISLVRSNDEGQIGFLRDLRRMNVAITRARMKVIIIADHDTLARHPFYRKLYSYISSLADPYTV